MLNKILPLAVLSALSLHSSAQTNQDPAAALESWRSSQGPGWTAEIDTRTGFARSLYGGHTQPGSHLFTDGAALNRARGVASSASAITGIDSATLVDDGALFLPLSSAGTTDKYTARFRQVVRGLPVVAGSVNVLMDMEGRALSIDSSAVPSTDAVRTTPIREASVAAAEALRAFTRIARVLGTMKGEPRLVLDQVFDGVALRATLAWEVDVFGDGQQGVPRGLRLRIADADLALTSHEELVHTCDVSGTVFTKLTPGTLPDIPANPTVQVPLAHILVTSPQGNATTDINGNFNIVGASAPLTVTVKYDGPFTTTTDAAAAVYSLPSNLVLASGNSILMNPSSLAAYTGEANSAYWIGRLRDYVRAVNPSDAHADFDATSNVNLAQTCNAYYTTGSVNFFSAGGGCVNTAYSSVVAHEMGHWLNVNYNSGNGPDGFGEGNADSWGMYLTDQPIIGENFYTNGAIIRTGLNTRQFCGDALGGCYGEVHNDGEVLMGALWKVRTRLKTTLGQSAGSATADLLFNSWMNAFDDTQIKTILRTHWLTVDDNDGYLGNGTPHYTDINQGFVDQGFPSYALIAVGVTNVTQLPNTTNEVGPYIVNATVAANLAPPLVVTELVWRSNGGSLNAIAMTPLGGDLFTASIPGQTSPAKIEYYVHAVDSLGGQGYFPGGAPATMQRFVVGDERVYYSDTFDNANSNWIIGTVSGANDWQYQVPAGKGGDPAAARTGTRCWGTDLGNSSFDGLYSANSSSWLESPAINLLSCPRPRLRFQRWLTVESALHDQARVLVNGQVVWQNTNVDLIDTGWTEVEYDISAIAAGNALTKVRFELVTDGQIQKGGWNIDDVQIVMVSAVGLGCIDSSTYCVGKLTSLGTIPSLNSLGSTSATLQTLRLELIDASLSKPGLILRSNGAASTPFNGGTLCVAQPIVRQFSYTTDAFGTALVPVTITPLMVGQTWYMQGWFRDPPASFGVGLSNGVQIRFCP